MIQIKKLLAVSFIAIAAVAMAGGGASILSADMKAGTKNKGHVTWKVKDVKKRFQAELEAEGERLRKNTPYFVVVGTNPPIPVMTDGFGEFGFEVQFRTLDRPVINKGDAASIVTVDGVVVAAGLMQ